MAGPPTSSNGASSFHLRWEVPPTPLVEVAATLEVLAPPVVPKLYFWALQADFASASGLRRGGAHLGLQFHPSYPGSGAVNWGGYHSGGGILDGSDSVLPSTLGNANTRDYGWEAGRPYRLRIAAVADRPGAWRGSVTDLATGTETVVRDLFVDADHLVAAVVWSEVFADCDDPSVTVRWSDFSAVTTGGEIRPRTVQLSYQAHGDGGCANTATAVDETGWFTQTTNTDRTNAPGSRLTATVD